MVDHMELRRATEMAQEFEQLDLSITCLKAGGKILRMIVGGPGEQQYMADVQAIHIEFDKKVSELVATALEKRKGELEQQLKKLGVTITPPSKRKT